MFFKTNEEENNQENNFYNERSHQDVYFIDVFDRRNNLQYCRHCDCYRGFMYDRCQICGNN